MSLGAEWRMAGKLGDTGKGRKKGEEEKGGGWEGRGGREEKERGDG